MPAVSFKGILKIIFAGFTAVSPTFFSEIYYTDPLTLQQQSVVPFITFQRNLQSQNRSSKSLDLFEYLYGVSIHDLNSPSCASLLDIARLTLSRRGKKFNYLRIL